MANPGLTREQMREAVDLVRKHGGVEPAAMAAGIPRGTLRNRYVRALHVLKDEPPPVEPEPIIQPCTSFEDAWSKWQRAIGMQRERYAGPSVRKTHQTSDRVRVVAAGDFHIPFHDRDAVAELIAREAGQTDILVLGGDFGDAQAASTFTKYEHVPFREELAEQTACIQALSEAFPTIKYLRGSNHMDRVEKRLRENNDTDLMDAILYLTGGELAPDVAMVKRYPNVQVDCWVTPQGKKVPWLMVVGDVAFSHAEKYSIVPGAATRKVDEWLTDFSTALGLPEIRAVVQFHTHAMSLLPWKADKVLLEPGCMCVQHAYQLGSKIGGRPQRVGYVTFELEDGRIDFESIRLRWMNRTEAVA